MLQRGRARAGAERKRCLRSTSHSGTGFNEAAPARARRVVRLVGGKKLPAKLQRGRARAGAERGSSHKLLEFFPNASTRPRPRGRGEATGLVGETIELIASTRPRPRGRGETRRESLDSLSALRFNEAAPARARRGTTPPVAKAWTGMASTRPRPRGRGEREHHLQQLHLHRSFNEAAPLGISCPTASSFNEAAPARARRASTALAITYAHTALQRGRARAGAESLMPAHMALLFGSGFNEAAPARARRVPRVRPGRLPPRIASTRPRPRGRGEFRQVTVPRR